MNRPDGTSGYRSPRQAWMIIFADVVGLLLAFFVLLFSMNSVQVDGWQAVVSTLTRRLNPGQSRTVPVTDTKVDSARIWRPRAMNLDYLNNLLETKIAADPVLAGITLSRGEERLVLSIPEAALYGPSARTGASEGGAVAGELGELLRQVSNQITVSFSAGGATTSDGEGSYMWRRALVRAIHLADDIRAGGYARNIHVFVRGTAHYSDSFDNRISAPDLQNAGPVQILIGKAGNVGGSRGD